jgi:hypothetical protein
LASLTDVSGKPTILINGHVRYYRAILIIRLMLCPSVLVIAALVLSFNWARVREEFNDN